MARDPKLPEELLKHFALNPVLLEPLAKHSVVLPTTTVMALQKNIHGPISRIYQLLLYTPTELLANEDFDQVRLDHVTQFLDSRYQQIGSLHHHAELREIDPLAVDRMVAEYQNNTPNLLRDFAKKVLPHIKDIEGVTPEIAEEVWASPHLHKALLDEASKITGIQGLFEERTAVRHAIEDAVRASLFKRSAPGSKI